MYVNISMHCVVYKSQRSRLIAFRKRKSHDKRKLKQRKICMAVSDSFSFSFTYHPRPLLSQLGETFFERAFPFLFTNISRDTHMLCIMYQGWIKNVQRLVDQNTPSPHIISFLERGKIWIKWISHQLNIHLMLIYSTEEGLCLSGFWDLKKNVSYKICLLGL